MDDAERADRLEAEAWRRAVEGVEKPVLYAGKIVRDEDGAPLMLRQYSDRLLELLLRAYRPERFGKPARALEDKIGEQDDASLLTDAERADRVARLLEFAGARRARPAAARRELASAAGTAE